MNMWMVGGKSRFNNCLQQSKMRERLMKNSKHRSNSAL